MKAALGNTVIGKAVTWDAVIRNAVIMDGIIRYVCCNKKMPEIKDVIVRNAAVRLRWDWSTNSFCPNGTEVRILVVRIPMGPKPEFLSSEWD
jgi:hypothetical protein